MRKRLHTLNRAALTCLLLMTASLITAQTRNITGRLISAGNDTLVGAVVKQKGTNVGTQTGPDGSYSLTVPDTANVTLIFSYIGYADKEVVVGLQSSASPVMEDDSKILDDVVVVGYGTVKKSDLTGSVASIKPDELKKVPTANIMESIQGKVAGVDITRTSGEAGAAVNVTVRGNRSITAGNGPLYIVDGVQYSNIQDINPNDIQSMEVLKDASSTAIYGSRGSNGVIIVTTKRGASGKTKVFFNSYTGFSQVEGMPEGLSGEQYIALRREAYRTNGIWNSVADDPKIFNGAELGWIADGTSTNYVDKLVHNGLQQDYQIGISGGTNKLKSYFSLDYYQEKGIVKLDELKRYTGRVNLDYSVNKYFKVGTQTQITYYDQSKRSNAMTKALGTTPLGPAFDDGGTLIYYPGTGANPNPLADEQANVYSNLGNTLRIFPTVYAELTPFKGFTARTNVSLNMTSAQEGLYAGAFSVGQLGTVSKSSMTNNNNNNLDWQGILNYTKEIKNHSFGITALTELIQNKTVTMNAQGQNQLVASQLFYNVGANTQNVAIASGYSKTALVSFAGRVNYAFKSRYLLTATMRSDGASVLAEGNKWDYFPSVAAGWRFSEEKFFAGAKKTFNTAKLRASYGLAGNASVAAYSSQNTLIRIPFAYGDNSATGYVYNSQIGNPDLKWEKSATADIGLDIGMLNDRIQFTGDVYDTHTNNLLLNRVLPLSTGVSAVTENVGKTRNRGIELSLTSVNIQKKNFQWSTTVTFMKNKEEVKELVGGVNILNIGTSSNPQYLVVGSPVNTFFDYQKVGIWQLGQEDEAAKFGQKPGDIHVKDVNGDGKINTDDRTVLGSQVPKWSGGFNSEFKYKGFDLSFYIYARVGQKVYLNNTGNLYDPRVQWNSVNMNGFDYWTPENPTNDLPRPNSNLTYSSLQYYNTIGYMNGSFVKLRNVQIGYTFPTRITQKVKIERLKVYVTGKNLITWSKTKNYDPEMNGSLNNPLVRLFIGGVNIDF
ncbi:SusC/RagA family protein [Sphingobacteriaceae bacterium]|nr:SusC/RagA family protein [Sphingobacteriaceae bacterium]